MMGAPPIIQVFTPSRARACSAAGCDFETAEAEDGYLLKHIHGLTGQALVYRLHRDTTVSWEQRANKVYAWLQGLHGEANG